MRNRPRSRVRAHRAARPRRKGAGSRRDCIVLVLPLGQQLQPAQDWAGNVREAAPGQDPLLDPGVSGRVEGNHRKEKGNMTNGTYRNGQAPSKEEFLLRASLEYEQARRASQATAAPASNHQQHVSKFRKAVKYGAKGRVALIGVSGSGKSFTALTLRSQE